MERLGSESQLCHLFLGRPSWLVDGTCLISNPDREMPQSCPIGPHLTVEDWIQIMIAGTLGLNSVWIRVRDKS